MHSEWIIRKLRFWVWVSGDYSSGSALNSCMAQNPIWHFSWNMTVCIIDKLDSQTIAAEWQISSEL